MLVLDFFLIHKSDGILGYLNVTLDCTSKFLPQFTRVGKLVFLSFAYFHILSDCKDSLSQGSTNCAHGDEHTRNVHVKKFSCARNYVHVNQSKHF